MPRETIYIIPARKGVPKHQQTRSNQQVQISQANQIKPASPDQPAKQIKPAKPDQPAKQINQQIQISSKSDHSANQIKAKRLGTTTGVFRPETFPGT